MDYFKQDLASLHNLLVKKELSVSDLTNATFDNIEKRDRKIGAFLNLNKEEALKKAAKLDEIGISADNILAGIPLGIKDNIVTKNLVTTAASKMLENFNPIYDATVMEKLNALQTITVGKTNMDEFAMGGSTESSAFKLTKNAWNQTKVPGGSSGGSAAAVASGEVIATLGSDTGGSIRQPAAYNGIVGVKPTYGRVSRYGLIAFASSLDQIGPLTRNVKDNAIMLNAISGMDPRDSTSSNQAVPDFVAKLDGDIKGMKIAVPTEYMGEGVAPEIRAAIKQAITTFEKLGATVDEVSLPHSKYGVPVYYIIASSEASSNLQRFDGIRYGHRANDVRNLEDVYVKSRSEGFGDEVKRRIMLGTFSLSAGTYDAFFKKAAQVRTLICQDFANVFSDYDLILGPTSPTTAFGIGEDINDPITMYMNDILTIPVNLAGLPGMSLPAGFADGLPIGMQLIANRFDEETMYRAGYAFEQATDFHKEIPTFGGARLMNFETTIGLEVHIEMKTNSKAFSAAPVKYGVEQNTNTNVVDWGFPGVLPTINKGALEYGMRAALALNCEITKDIHFDRKNYFYPDNPKAYQITQSQTPIGRNGWLEIEVDGKKKKIGIEEMHVEEDAGKNTHNPDGYSYVDLNRQGTPLIEIVSKPDIASADEAYAYLVRLRQIIQFTGVSDVKMEEGSMRADVNVSVRPIGSDKFGTKTEMKNLNSFEHVRKGTQYEAKRQQRVLLSGGEIQQETRRFDEPSGETILMRVKEGASDYRYFPEPDIPPIHISNDWIEEVRKSIPEMPDKRREKYVVSWGIPEYDAGVLTQTKEMSDFFEETVANGADAKLAANWLMGEVNAYMNANKLELLDTKLTPEHLASMIKLIEDGTISSKIAKKVFQEIIANNSDPKTWVEEKGLVQLSDPTVLEPIIETILDNNEKSVDDFKNGKDRAIGFLVGQIMKETHGKANPKVVNKLLMGSLKKR